jgi:hypothetical protein
MLITKEYNRFDEIMDMCWSGAIDTLKDIERNNREDEFMSLLEEMFTDGIPTDTEVNDFIWFDRNMIYEHCGLDENGNEPKDYDEETIENSLEELNTTDDFEDFCDDCETCCLDKMCDAYDNCKEMFEDVKNQVIPFDVFTNEAKESYGY